jgi:hypothetical protein
MVAMSVVRLEETTHGHAATATQPAGGVARTSTRPRIALDENHRLVLMTREIDWTELEELVQAIR